MCAPNQTWSSAMTRQLSTAQETCRLYTSHNNCQSTGTSCRILALAVLQLWNSSSNCKTCMRQARFLAWKQASTLTRYRARPRGKKDTKITREPRMGRLLSKTDTYRLTRDWSRIWAVEWRAPSSLFSLLLSPETTRLKLFQPIMESRTLHLIWDSEASSRVIEGIDSLKDIWSAKLTTVWARTQLSQAMTKCKDRQMMWSVNASFRLSTEKWRAGSLTLSSTMTWSRTGRRWIQPWSLLQTVKKAVECFSKSIKFQCSCSITKSMVQKDFLFLLRKCKTLEAVVVV